jgi:hypothetical protein
MTEAIPLGPRTDTIANTPAPQPETPTVTATPQPEGPKPTSLADILKQARETGENKRKGSENTTWAKAKEFAKAAWKNTAEEMKQMKKDYTAISDTINGLATNSEVRAALAGYIQERSDTAKRELKIKFTDVKDGIIASKDAALKGCTDRLKNLWIDAKKTLIQPQIDRATQISRDIQSTWKETTTAGKEVADIVVGFCQDQARNTQNGIRARSAEVQASWNTLLARPGELTDKVIGGFATKLEGYASAGRASARERRARASEHQVHAQNIRNLQARKETPAAA